MGGGPRTLVAVLAVLLTLPPSAATAQAREVEETAYALLAVNGPLDPGRCYQEVYATWTPVPGALGYGIEYFDSHPQINREDSRSARPGQNDGAQRGLSPVNTLLTGAYGPCEGTVGHPLFSPGRFDVHRATVTLPANRPTAAFSATADEGTVAFDASASTPDGAPITDYAWDFGDGSTGAGVTTSHTYAEAGDYTATLIITDANGLGDVAQQVVSPEIAEPQLTVTLDLPDNAEGSIALQETVRVRATVAATDPGMGGTLVDVRPSASDQALVLTGPLELLSPFQPVAPATLDAGTTATFIATVRATAEAEVGITTTWRAMQDDGDVVTATDELSPIRVNPLEVDVVADPNPLDLGVDNDGDDDIDAEDAHTEITVRVTNRSSRPISSIDALDPTSVIDFDDLREDPEEPGTALCLVGGDVQQPPPTGSATCFDEDLRPTTRPTPESSFGDLAPGAHAELTYTYEVFDELFADATVTVIGSDAGENVRGTGATEVRGSADIVARISLRLEATTVRGGQVVRVLGTVENTSDDTLSERDVAVMLHPTVTGNGGGGYLREAGQGTRTAVESEVLQPPPGETVDVDGVIGTLAVPEISQTTVEYLPEVMVREEDGWVAARDAQVEVETDVDAGIGLVHTAQVTVEPAVPEAQLICPDNPGLLGGVDHVSCRFSRGVFAFGTGMGGLAKLVGQGFIAFGEAEYRTVAWACWALGESFDAILGDAAARDALRQDLAISLQALKDVGDPILQAIPDIPFALVGALDRFYREWDERLSSGDLVEITGALAEVVGESPDLAFEALVAARAMRRMLAGTTGVVDNAANAALRDRVEHSADDIEQQARAAVARGEDPATNGTFANGVDVTNAPFITRSVYGMSPVDTDNVLRISLAERVQIAFRSRHPRAAELLQRALAWPKPAGLYLKSVNDIDVTYLGYADEWLATVQLVEPPIPWVAKGPDRTAAIDAYLNQFADLNGTSGIARTRRAEVAERLETRLDEWPDYLNKYSEYADRGVPVDFGGRDNAVPDALRDYVGDNVPRRRAEITSSTFTGSNGAPGRRRFELKIEGPNGEPFRLITGDIDFVAILNPDGTAITSIFKRVRLYRQLRSLLGMQHGETFAWVLTGKRRKLLGNHLEGARGSETLLVAGPDGRMRTAKLRDNLSIAEEGPNAGLSGTPDFLLLSGLPHHLVSDSSLGGLADLLEPLRLYADLLGSGDLVPLGLTRELVDGLQDDLSQRIERGVDGSPCRPDQRGGLECYGTAERRAGPARSEFAGGDGLQQDLAEELDDVTDAGYVEEAAIDPFGNAWQPADPVVVVAEGDPDVLELAPLTYTAAPTAPGAVSLPAVTDPTVQGLPADTPLFAPGDLIIVGPGHADAEIVRVASDDPLVLSTPLRSHHAEGTPLLLHTPVDEQVTRIAGPGRLETSVAISRDGFPVDGSAAAVVLARGDDFPDALAGTPLAVALGGPLLLTPTDRLDPLVLVEIQRVLPAGGPIHVLGGEVAVSPAVAEGLTAAGFEVIRHAGASRYDTAAVVADALAAMGAADAVVLATGNAAPDALAAGVVAARQEGVVLLTNGDQPVAPTTEWLEDLFGRNLLALGGPAAAAYPDAEAIVGGNRFETAALAAARIPPEPAAMAVVASGERFPDALSGGWLAARAGGTVLYAGQSSLPAATADRLAQARPGRVAVLGGAAALADGVLADVSTAVGGGP